MLIHKSHMVGARAWAALVFSQTEMSIIHISSIHINVSKAVTYILNLCLADYICKQDYTHIHTSSFIPMQTAKQSRI